MKNEYEEEMKHKVTLIFIIASITTIILCFVAFQGCTLSFNNVMTDGTASDVVDSEPKTDADISPTVSFPVEGL